MVCIYVTPKRIPLRRKMKTFRIWLMLALSAALAAFVLAACSTTSAEDAPDADAPAEAAAQTHDVTDVYGRTVTLPADVKSAATVGSGARFVVYAGGQDKLVAVTEMETEPSMSRPYTVVHADLFASLPATSNGNHLMETNVNAEQMLELNPDVIISSRSAEECDALQQATGIPVVGISYQNQLFSDDVYASIRVVGEALGTSEHAEATVRALEGWQKDLDGRTAKIDDANRPSVYVGAVNYKGAKSFSGSYCNYAPLNAVHGKNVADELGEKGAVDVDLEQLGAWDPDVMFLNAGNMDLMKKDYVDNQAFFDGLSAFENGRLYTQPTYNMNGTNVEMGVCDAYFIGATLYPEAFADVDLEATYSEIFTTMLGGDFRPAMKDAGMDFKTLSFS